MRMLHRKGRSVTDVVRDRIKRRQLVPVAARTGRGWRLSASAVRAGAGWSGRRGGS